MESNSYLQLYNKLDGARIEGRLENVTQRQKEIYKLHQAIQASEKELVQALKNDLGWNQVESLLELTTVLQALRVLFEAHDIKKSLADEHLICTSQKTVTRHVPLGNILILAEASSPLAQSIIPLCLAVAEGNSALVILSHAAPETSAILLEIINENTDQDAIVAIKPESSSDSTRILGIFEKVAWHGIFVQSNSSKAEIEGLGFQQSSLSVRLLFQPPRNSIVIVTRNADIQKTARHIAMGKFSFFAGKSVVAPALVLVDEFVIAEFLSALESCIRGIIVGRPPRMKAKKQVLQPETSRALNNFVNGTGGKGAYAIQISPGGSEETLLIGPQEWSKENFPHFQGVGAGTDQKLGYSDPVLAIQPTTSMEAAIKITNELNEKSSTAVVYFFSNSSEARYLSLFTASTSKYLNHIPLETCLSPYPPSATLNLSPLLAQTHLIHPASTSLSHPSSKQLQQAISSGKGKLAGLRDLISLDLAPPIQKSGFQVGFFPQGGFVGLGHLLLLVGLSVTGVIWGVRSSLGG